MKLPSEVQEWIYKAEEDYFTAVTLARQRRKTAPDNLCFSAQQCAEKYLKALLVLRKIPFPKTHDLIILAASNYR